MRNVEFVPKAFKEYQEWIEKDRKTALSIGDLIKEILSHHLKVWANQNR